MIRRTMSSVMRRLTRIITQPRDELGRWQRAVRFCYDLAHHGARQLRDDRAPQMAAALAFRALFALFPVLVVGTILVRAVIGIDEFLTLIDELFASAKLGEVRVVLPAGAAGQSDTLRQWLDTLVGEAAAINLAAVGWVGLVVVLYAAIGLVVTIENAFNIVYRAPQGRSWTRRVPLYWFILTVSPVAIGIIAYVNSYFEGWIASVETWQWLLAVARVLWSCLVGWLLMVAVYALIPNTTVDLRPAAIGALVSVILLQFGIRTLGAYLENAFSISQLYGSLGLIPLFMFWVYLMWLAVLFGLEVSATLQLLHGRRLEEIERKRERTGLIDPAAVLTVMEIIAERFCSGRQTTSQKICEQTAIAPPIVESMLERLIEAGVLHRIDRSENIVCLSRPPEQVFAGPLLDIGFSMVDADRLGRPSSLLKRLRHAQTSLAAGITLAALVEVKAAAVSEG